MQFLEFDLDSDLLCGDEVRVKCFVLGGLVIKDQICAY